MVLLMLLQTAMLAFSQVALKLAMEGLEWQWSWSFIWHHVILNLWLMVAVALMIGANLFWLWMLHKYPLSQVYPLTSLGFIEFTFFVSCFGYTVGVKHNTFAVF